MTNSSAHARRRWRPSVDVGLCGLLNQRQLRRWPASRTRDRRVVGQRRERAPERLLYRQCLRPVVAPPYRGRDRCGPRTPRTGRPNRAAGRPARTTALRPRSRSPAEGRQRASNLGRAPPARTRRNRRRRNGLAPSPPARPRRPMQAATRATYIRNSARWRPRRLTNLQHRAARQLGKHGACRGGRASCGAPRVGRARRGCRGESAHQGREARIRVVPFRAESGPRAPAAGRAQAMRERSEARP